MVSEELDQRGIELKIPFVDLWEWYGRFSSGDYDKVPLAPGEDQNFSHVY